MLKMSCFSQKVYNLLKFGCLAAALQCNIIEDLFKAPTGHRTASRQRLFEYRAACCDRWTLVNTLHLVYLTPALRSIRWITAPFLVNLHRIGVRGDALCWMSSYLTERTQCVSVDDHLPCEIRLQHGVPQGSDLGPLLFSVGLYCTALSEVFLNHDIRYHVNAVDMGTA